MTLQEAQQQVDNWIKTYGMRYFNVFGRRQDPDGAYAAVMNGVDHIIFTGGIGENDEMVRREVMKDMDYLGAVLDEEKSNTLPRGTIENISASNSRVQIWRIPTDEELVIARDTERLVTKK